MELEQFLDTSEVIKWRGKPKGGLLLRVRDIFLIPFSLLWGGLATEFFFMTVSDDVAESIFDIGLIISTVLFIIGQYVMYGRFIFDAISRANTEYYVTSDRAVIVSGLYGKSIDAMPLRAGLQIQVSGSKRGTITFGPGRGFQWFNLNPFYLWQGPMHPFAFEQIRNVDEVYQLIRTVQQGRG